MEGGEGEFEAFGLYGGRSGLLVPKAVGFEWAVLMLGIDGRSERAPSPANADGLANSSPITSLNSRNSSKNACGGER